MRQSVRTHTSARPAQTDERLGRAWSALKAHLDSRSRELSEEVRSYPTPIARCDEQLTKLIEQRGRALERAQAMAAIESARANEFTVLAREFCASYPPCDDPTESALLARLREALAP